jgi:hypothetical protein
METRRMSGAMRSHAASKALLGALSETEMLREKLQQVLAAFEDSGNHATRLDWLEEQVRLLGNRVALLERERRSEA